MKNRKSLLQWAVLVLFVLFFSASVSAVVPVDEKSENEQAEDVRADLILIDSAAQFGDLEQPVAAFYHDQHTRVAAKLDKDCTACHLVEEEDGEKSLALKYMRTEDVSASQLKKIYHDNCVACHEEAADRLEESGPLTADCKGCHTGPVGELGPGLVIPYGMDLSLHARHVQASAKRMDVKQDETCSACHHVYDAEKEELVYAKGEEGTCRYCHKSETPLYSEKTEDEIPLYKYAAHDSCVQCHYDLSKQNVEDNGPLECAGCHSQAEQQKVEKLDPVPGIDRGQPDHMLLVSGEEQPDGELKVDWASSVGVVPFDHKSHVTSQETCRVCHHDVEDQQGKLASCDTAGCHPSGVGDLSPGGSVKGGVNLAQASHSPGSEHSCVGCHVQQALEGSCAGCHTDPTQFGKNCSTCHVQEGFPQEGEQTFSAEELSAKAEQMIVARPEKAEKVDLSRVPEKVVINHLDYEGDEWKASEMPHRKIFAKIVELTKDDKLANHYHQSELALCQGCHHYTEIGYKQPSCASCHGKPFDERTPGRPGLKGAFHIQCIDCHQAMEVKPKATECEGCHKPKNQ
jgi:hypothetical protein